jgi:hypothetical protein
MNLECGTSIPAATASNGYAGPRVTRPRPGRLQACRCHINGNAFNPCSLPVSDIQPTDQITTIEGLPATIGQELHPMQQAWLKYDVGQSGYCQPGPIMGAVALSRRPPVCKAHSYGAGWPPRSQIHHLPQPGGTAAQ